MKVFANKSGSRDTYYVVTDDGDVFISSMPHIDGPHHVNPRMITILRECDLISLCNCGSIEPFNSEAFNLVERHNKKRDVHGLKWSALLMVVMVALCVLSVVFFA